MPANVSQAESPTLERNMIPKGNLLPTPDLDPAIPRAITNLEIHVSHACNLTCESCAHYSNQGHKGLLALEDADRWMGAWRDRIAPRIFSLVGGEPTIHPELAAVAALAGQHWPSAIIRVLTNGFFLHRHPQLPRVLARFKSCIEISVHHDSPEYMAKLMEIQKLVDGWSNEYGTVIRWTRSFGMWTRRYQGWGSAMQPFDDRNPRSSWQHCRARLSPQLFQGQIWKCPALAYLGMQNEKYHLAPEWAYYLTYRPLEPSCSPEELDSFFGREEESYCGMCPARPEQFRIASPLIPLSTWQATGRPTAAEQGAPDKRT